MLRGVDAVAETLRLAREEIEAQIARYRLLLFASVTVLSAATGAAANAMRGDEVSADAVLYWLTATAYACLAFVWRRRYGASPTYVAVTSVLDMAAVVLIYPVLTRFLSGEDVETFARYLAAPGLILVLMVNAMRGSATVNAVATVVAAVVLYLAVMRWVVTRFEVMQIVSTGLIVLAGALGILWTRHSRRRLEIHARVSLLQRFVSSAAVDRVLSEDASRVLDVGGSLVTVTLLSSDLRGFTAMSEQMTPAEVVDELNAYHHRMQDVVARHGGVLDKFIGDGALVVFGYPDAEDAGAGAAVACAREMLDALSDLNRERESAGRAPLAMGIGVHTGEAIAGAIGVPGRRLEFTFIGDAVNTAARIEGLTKEAGTPLLVSAATVERLPADHRLTTRGEMAIRGKAAVLSVYGTAD